MSYSSARQLEHVINFEINESSKPNKSTSRARVNIMCQIALTKWRNTNAPLTYLYC